MDRFTRNLDLAEIAAARAMRRRYAISIDDTRQAALIGLTLADRALPQDLPDAEFRKLAQLYLMREIIAEVRAANCLRRRVGEDGRYSYTYPLDPNEAHVARELGLLHEVVVDGEDFDFVDPAPSPEANALRSERNGAFVKALDQLEPRDRQILMRRLAGQQQPDIGKVFGVTGTRICQRLAIATERVREGMGEE